MYVITIFATKDAERAPSRHLTVSLRDFELVSDTALPSGILCQVGNTRCTGSEEDLLTCTQSASQTLDLGSRNINWPERPCPPTVARSAVAGPLRRAPRPDIHPRKPLSTRVLPDRDEQGLRSPVSPLPDATGRRFRLSDFPFLGQTYHTIPRTLSWVR